MPLALILDPTPPIVTGPARGRRGALTVYRRAPLPRSNLHVWRFDSHSYARMDSDLPFRPSVRHSDIATSYADILPEHLLAEMRLLPTLQRRRTYRLRTEFYRSQRGFARGMLTLLRDDEVAAHLIDMVWNRKRLGYMMDRVRYALDLQPQDDAPTVEGTEPDPATWTNARRLPR